MLRQKLYCGAGCGMGCAAVGEVTVLDGVEGAGEVGWGAVVVLGAEYVLEPRLPVEVRPPPARAKTSSGIRKHRKKNNVKSMSPFIIQRLLDIKPPGNQMVSFISSVSSLPSRQTRNAGVTGALAIPGPPFASNRPNAGT
jgi:hypothetical protein